ncbi:MAG: hypothetical protein NTY77_15455 [Elusimicrobia bacterium]|nr:hypothetical protein [Elusimicrobiota bacterium]
MDLKQLDDDALLAQLKMLVRREQEDVSQIIAHLAEVDSRELILERSFPSLFAYCVRELGYTDAAAYLRIRAARAARLFPQVIDLLRAGELSLETILRLHPHLDGPDGARLLASARGKSKRDVETLVAGLSPLPDRPDFARVISVGPRPQARPDTDEESLFAPCAQESTIPSQSPGQSGSDGEPLPVPPAQPRPDGEPLPVPPAQPRPDGEPLPVPPPPVAPPALQPPPGGPAIIKRVQFAFTADEELLLLLRRAQEVLWHKYPSGRFEDIFRDALIALLQRKDMDVRVFGKLPEGVVAKLPEARNRQKRGPNALRLPENLV